MSGTDELIAVIQSRNIGKLSELLEKMALDEINKISCNYGYSALHFACQGGYNEALDLIVAKNGIDVNVKSEHGNTPLLMAICFGNTHAVSKILSNPQVDVNVQNVNGRTPLHFALEDNHHQIVKELLASPGIDVNVQDVHGNTPLLLACDKNYHLKRPESFQIVKELLANPAVDVNVGRLGITALMWSAGRCDEEVFKLLLEDPRVDLDAKDEDGRGLEEQLDCVNGKNKRNCLDMLNNERKKRENRELQQEQPSQEDSNIGKGIEKIDKLNKEMEDLEKKWKENLDSRKQKKRDLNDRQTSDNEMLAKKYEEDQAKLNKKYKENEAKLKKMHEEEETVLDSTFAREDEIEQRHFAILRERRDELVQELEKLTIHPLHDSSEDRNKVEAAESSLECPVCFELMRPPTRIWMCKLSHIVCEPCKDGLDKKKENRGICPTCMTERVNMRAWMAENFARTIFKE